MPTHSAKGEGWKANIITNPPEEEDDFDEDRFAYRAEIKSRIVNLVVGSGGLRRSEIVDEISKPDGLVRDCLKELCEEDALQVEER